LTRMGAVNESGRKGQCDTMGRCILIVEDDQPFAVTLAMILQLEGHTVLVANNALEGVRVGIARRPDIVIADWMLGGDLDGGDVCREILMVSRRTKTIIITGYLNITPEIGRWSEYGVEIIEKPFHKEELLGAVERAFAKPPQSHNVQAEQTSGV
jgi:DNA-binding NtrC family response regulator